MRYVRVKFNDAEFVKVKSSADEANMLLSRYIRSKVLDAKENPYYFYNLIVILLEEISKEIQRREYNENTSKVFFYLYTIEKILREKL